MSQPQANQSGCSFPQRLVTQQPVYDKRQVMDKRLKVLRPIKKHKNMRPKFL